ncbi:hypothetical protein Sme01_03160 [Sphaerisporangium melleum]|uniref:Uncharacterized protein n=1 Tax=Sphaerisporangium melleum TaxID=321316 RepID=A0A917QP53_9ACTN|nr:hypothetical protein [Sphaerisporangium melleum]GGK61468.1 hypothetical protein GCM10007964_00700 [Sphaerisporangium melleum]GII67840.1 hypothetical protein Sme01_03160 [Sphaerisporangium melleum]
MAWSLVASDTAAFADGNAGHIFDLGSAPTVGDIDVLFVNSDTVVSTPAGWTLPSGGSLVTNQGAYVFYRIAVGGESSTVTITTSGDFNAAAGWSRWRGGKAFDVAGGAQVNSAVGGATPSLTLGPLAEANELVVVAALLHRLASPTPSTPVWSSGYTSLTSVTQGTGNPGCTQFVAYKTGAGTASETPSCTWTDGAFDRYILAVAFTIDPGGPAQRDATDSVAVSDATAGTLAAGRASADSFTVSDSPSRAVTRTRGTSDVLAVSDNAGRGVAVLRNAADEVVISDDPGRALTGSRAATDSAVPTDTPTRALSTARSAPETVQLGDTATSAVTLLAAATDAVSVSDDVQAVPTTVAGASDSASFEDTAVAVLTLSRGLADTVTVEDVAFPASTVAASAADTLTFDAAAAAAALLPRTVSDAVDLADEPAAALAYTAHAADAVHLADTATRSAQTFLRPASDAVHVTDTATIADPGIDITVTVAAPTRVWSVGRPWI